MLLLHESLVLLFFGWTNGPYNNFPQVQDIPPDDVIKRTADSTIPHPKEFVQNYR
jgi:hypothetical protein